MKTPTLSRWHRIAGHPVVLAGIMLCLIPFSVVSAAGPATQNPTVSISGSVAYFAGDLPVDNVALTVSGGTSDIALSDAEGQYQFIGLETGLDYLVTAAREMDDTPVSALDASFILRYLVHAMELDQYQMTSGDVTVDGHLTAFDATVILRHIVHITNVPDHRIGIWSFAPESLFYPALSADQTDRDYTGLIIGDVSGNWRQQVVPDDTVDVWLTECDAEPGKSLQVDLFFGDIGGLEIFSAECVVSYDPGILIFDSLATEGTPYPDIGAVMYAMIDDGEISIAWAGVEAPQEGGRFVSLVFRLSPTAPMGGVYPIHFQSFMFNEGNPLAAAVDGAVHIGSETDVVVSGVVEYCHSKSSLDGVEMILSGFDSRSIRTGEAGTYVFASLRAGEDYCVTPQKDDVPENVITSYDAALVARHFVALCCDEAAVLRGCDLLAADVTDNGGVTSFDASRICRYVLGLETYARIGTWKFLPDSLCYADVSSDLNHQNFSAIIYGEVSGNISGTVDTTVEPEVTVFLPDTTASPGAAVRLPVLIDVLHRDCLRFLDIYSIDMKLVYDANLLAVDSIALNPGIENIDFGYKVEHPQGAVKISLYNYEPLDLCAAGPTLFFWIYGRISSETVPGETGSLRMEKLLLNEGSPRGQVEGGGVLIQPPSISGMVRYCEGFPYVHNTEIRISGDVVDTALTDDMGNYTLGNLAVGGRYCITPYKEGDLDYQTITAFDAVLTARGIAGLVQFSICDSMAADVNGDELVNVLDVVMILRYFLGLKPESDIGEWRFVPPEVCFDSLSSSHSRLDFDAILCGDVSQNWVEPSPPLKPDGIERTSTKATE